MQMENEKKTTPIDFGIKDQGQRNIILPLFLIIMT